MDDTSILGDESPFDEAFDQDSDSYEIDFESPVLGLTGLEFEDSYDTSTREGREKLAKDIHRAVRGDSMMMEVAMSSSYIDEGYGVDMRTASEKVDDVEQMAFELAIEEGATSRPLDSEQVRESVYEAADADGRREEDIDPVESYGSDLGTRSYLDEDLQDDFQF